MPASSGTRYGNGAGWGGPAKGAGAPKAPPLDGGGIGPGRGHLSEKTVARQLSRLERQDDYDRRFDEALDRTEAMAKRLHERINSAKGDMGFAALASAAGRLDAEVMDRTRGRPVQTNLNVNRDDVTALSDAELRAELEAVGGEATSALAGSETAAASE